MPENPKPPYPHEAEILLSPLFLRNYRTPSASYLPVHTHNSAHRGNKQAKLGCIPQVARRDRSGPRLTVNLARRDRVLDRLGALAVDLAADRVGGAEDLLDNSLERLGEGLEAHRPGDLDDLVQGHGLVVLDVLLLLAVARGLLQGADDEGGGGGDDGHGGLTVLDGELHGDAKTLLLVGEIGFVSFLSSSLKCIQCRSEIEEGEFVPSHR